MPSHFDDATPTGTFITPARYEQVAEEEWRLCDDLIYEWVYDGHFNRITVHQGFIMDMASVPRILHPLIGRWDLREAAVLHDAQYRSGGHPAGFWLHERSYESLANLAANSVVPAFQYSPWERIRSRWIREESDRLFARVMRERGVDPWKRRWAYKGVRVFGGSAWNEKFIP
jgi:hypothetical protein